MIVRMWCRIGSVRGMMIATRGSCAASFRAGKVGGVLDDKIQKYCLQNAPSLPALKDPL